MWVELMKILHQLPPFRCGFSILKVHLQAPNMLKLDVKQLVIVEMQATTCKPHSHMFIHCWGLFAINNGLHVDLVNPQMLQCIIKILNLNKHLAMFWCKNLFSTKV
jgi:hypothetical protein